MAEKDSKPGPEPKDLNADERSKFLALIGNGFGIHMALAELRVGWQRFARTKKNDRDFRRDVKHALEQRRENLVALRHSHAMAGDPKALEFLIGRDDASERFVRERREARRREKESARRAAEAEAKLALADDRDEFPELSALHGDEIASLLHTLGRLVSRKALPPEG